MFDVSPPAPGRSSTSVAFRLKRPYASEEELVAGDAHGIRKSGMLLFGAAPRPVGLIVRFEVALADGTPVFRGEGKVVAYHPAAPPEQTAALQVKFTRLDPRGKAIVDRAVQRNEARPPSSVRSPLSLPPPPDSGPISARGGAPLDTESLGSPRAPSIVPGPISVRPPSPSIVPSPPDTFTFEGDGGGLVAESAEASPHPVVVTPAPALVDDGATDLSETRVAEAPVVVLPDATSPSPSAAEVREPDVEPEYTIPLALTTPKPGVSRSPDDTREPALAVAPDGSGGDLDIDVQVELPPQDHTLPLQVPTAPASADRPTPPPAQALDAATAPEPELIDEPTVALPQVMLAPRAEQALPSFPSEPDDASAAPHASREMDKNPDQIRAPSPSPVPSDVEPEEDEHTLPLVARTAPLVAPPSPSGVVVRDRESLLDKLRSRAKTGAKVEVAAETSAEALGRLRRLAGSSNEP